MAEGTHGCLDKFHRDVLQLDPDEIAESFNVWAVAQNKSTSTSLEYSYLSYLIAHTKISLSARRCQ